MARWVNAADLRTGNYGINDALQSGIAAYGFGEDVKQGIQERELGETMAAIPEAVTQKDTEQSAMLAEQTDDFGEGIPTSEKMALRSAGRRRIPATRDWKTWEDSILKQAGAMGPEALQSAQAHITKTQQDGFTKAATRAMQLMETNPQGAARALEEAYSNMPDSNSADVTLAPDGTVMFQSIDEDTGEPEGEPVSVTAEGIADIIQQMKDPVAWGAAVKEGRIASETAAEKKRQFDATEKRLGEKSAADIKRDEFNNKLNQKKFDLDNLRYKEASPAREAAIKKLEADIAKIYRDADRSDVKLTLEDEDRNRNLRLKEAEQELKAANNPLEQEKLRAEIAKLKADASYIKGGKGRIDLTKLHAMPHKDLVEQIGKTEEILREAEYEVNVEEPSEDAQRRYQQVSTLLRRLYSEESKRRGVNSAPVTAPDGSDTGIPTPAAAAAPASTPQKTAPPAAVSYLQTNPTPAIKQAFQAKYGYLPPGI